MLAIIVWYFVYYGEIYTWELNDEKEYNFITRNFVWSQGLVSSLHPAFRLQWEPVNHMYQSTSE